MNKTILFSFLKFSHDDFVFNKEQIKESYAHIWKKEKFFYVYLVITYTDIEKYYIGYHCGQLDDLDTGKYKTSSSDKHFKDIMNDPESNKDIFIISIVNSKFEGLLKEHSFLRLYNVRYNSFFWNKSSSTSGHIDQTGLKRSPETIEKLRLKRKIYNQTEIADQNRKKHSEIMKERFNLNTLEGQSRRKYNNIKSKEQFDKNTEEGLKNRERQRENTLKRFDKNTEEGLKNRERYREITLKQFDKNTEEGLKNVLHHQNKAFEQFEKVRLDKINSLEPFEKNDNRLKNILISFNIRDEDKIKKYFIKNIDGVEYFILNLYSFFSRFTIKSANNTKKRFNIKMQNRNISKENLKSEILKILKDISPTYDFDERDIDLFIL